MFVPRVSAALFCLSNSVEAITMMTRSRALQSQQVTPVEKVVTLLEDLKAEVESDGTAESSAYSEYACFCKDTSTSKSESITGGKDKINLLSAEIASKTATKAEKS